MPRLRHLALCPQRRAGLEPWWCCVPQLGDVPRCKTTLISPLLPRYLSAQTDVLKDSRTGSRTGDWKGDNCGLRSVFSSDGNSLWWRGSTSSLGFGSPPSSPGVWPTNQIYLHGLFGAGNGSPCGLTQHPSSAHSHQ